jgi:hypothetical protein
MSKQISDCFRLIGIGALVIGLAGCSSTPPAPPPPVNNPVPGDVINKLKGMPPAQQQQILAQMKGTKAGNQMEQAVGSGQSQGASGSGQ